MVFPEGYSTISVEKLNNSMHKVTIPESFVQDWIEKTNLLMIQNYGVSITVYDGGFSGVHDDTIVPLPSFLSKYPQTDLLWYPNCILYWVPKIPPHIVRGWERPI